MISRTFFFHFLRRSLAISSASSRWPANLQSAIIIIALGKCIVSRSEPYVGTEQGAPDDSGLSASLAFRARLAALHRVHRATRRPTAVNAASCNNTFGFVPVGCAASCQPRQDSHPAVIPRRWPALLACCRNTRQFPGRVAEGWKFYRSLSRPYRDNYETVYA